MPGFSWKHGLIWALVAFFGVHVILIVTAAMRSFVLWEITFPQGYADDFWSTIRIVVLVCLLVGLMGGFIARMFDHR